ncbi:MAG TPA: metal ABC transporter permease [Beijerinckiaceae bacterium]|nr:metal ABC transporter permease [Beijerinckiaceae bacterium]
MLYDALIAPFAEFDFMRRALVGVLAIALAGGPVGVFLMLRRMSLTGDAMAHGILPGAAVAYLVAGLSLPAMTVGGLIAGVTVAMLAGLVARATALKEDASLAAFYLLSLALGVTIVSMRGSSVDLFHVLFGTVLAVGLMMLPAAASRFWSADISSMIAIAVAIGAGSGVVGLLLSYHAELPAGPAIVLSAGAAYLLSLAGGREGGLFWLALPRRHLEA